MVDALQAREQPRQSGGVAVETGLLMVLFFVLLLGVFDLARMIFLWNTLASISRRAAITVATSLPASDHSIALSGVAFGGVPLSVPRIDGTYFRVEYLNADHVVIATPASATDNLRNCMRHPRDPVGCVRSVRIRLCQPGATECERVRFEPLFPLGGALGADIRFPTFETITPVGSLGYRPGTGN